MAGNITHVYGSSTSITITLGNGSAGLASSSTLLAGRQSTSFDFSSANYSRVHFGGKITSGSTAPTAGTSIEVWLIWQLATGSWPTPFGASDADVTVVPNRDVLFAYGESAARIIVTNATSQEYDWNYTCLAPQKVGALWVVQNTGQQLSITAANHAQSYIGVSNGYT